MSLATILAFALAILLLALTPGPGMLACIARALSAGLAPAFAVMAGTKLADLIFLSLAIAGMTGLSFAMGEWFVVVKIAGGGYLIWLGYRLWIRDPAPPAIGPRGGRRGLLGDLFAGLTIGLSNPKVIVFFAALLPTFVDLGGIGASDVLILVSLVLGIAIAVDVVAVMLAVRARRLFTTRTAMRRLNRLAGVTMAVLGAAVATR
ncbi:MAG: LysE family translocator [Alphaproteobacteria bacterium]|jgi:threonine/homoserine/homoserine lactone efflux protein|nr:LysE family translocator [Alphaproteobacteria bacterium]MDP6567889.1 LysE family translocator [Alphaproteobacteria bacterium]MDP6816381.1 LysE family translocator [Alphaproteobacteria bacterium]